jgi:hypothetical protein
MNWKECERKGSCLNLNTTPVFFPEGLRKIMNNLRISGVPTEI